MIPSEVKDTIYDALWQVFQEEIELSKLYCWEEQHHLDLAQDCRTALKWLEQQEVEP